MDWKRLFGNRRTRGDVPPSDDTLFDDTLSDVSPPGTTVTPITAPDPGLPTPQDLAKLLGGFDTHLLEPLAKLMRLQDELLAELSAEVSICPALEAHRALTVDLRQRLIGTFALARLDNALPLSPRPVAVMQMIHNAAKAWAEQAATHDVTLDITLSPDLPGGILIDPTLFQCTLDQLALAVLRTIGSATLCLHISPGEGELHFDLSADADAARIASDPAYYSACALARHLGGTLKTLPGKDAELELELRIPARAITIPDQSHAPISDTPYLSVESARSMAVPMMDVGDVPAPPRIAPTHAGLRIGLAEDLVINQRLFAAQTEPSGAQVKAFMQAETLLEAHARAPFDIVFMDLHMPGMGGIAAIKTLREAGDNTPIVAFTADGTAQTHAAAMHAGANLIVTKPLSTQQLIEALDYCVSLRRHAA